MGFKQLYNKKNLTNYFKKNPILIPS